MVRVSDILSEGLGKYLDNHKLSFKQRKVLSKVINCFSDKMPELVFECSNKDCGYTEHKKQPCRDRHCNRCNNNKKMKWVVKLVKQFPPLPYYHIVFTLPHELNNLFICNQKLLYDMFFKSSFYVLNKFGSDKKHFGGKIGYLGLLHTWGQKLNYHVHIHFMVLAGGIKEGQYKQLPYYKDFIFPVEAMSKVMMGKFIEMLKVYYEKRKLKFPGKLEAISSEQKFNNFLYKLSKKEWVIYSKKPFRKSDKVLEYISRYAYKVAISNNRIKSYANGEVIFEYRDYYEKDKNDVPKKKTAKLSEIEFIRRYLLHILPNRFRKIRYGGIFSSNQKSESLKIIKEYFETVRIKLKESTKEWIEQIEKQINYLCPYCMGKLLPKKTISLSGYV